MVTPSTRVLIADSDAETRRELFSKLLDQGIFSDYASDGRMAVQRLADESYGLVILDLSLEHVPATHIIDLIGRMSPRPIVIATTTDVTRMPLDSEAVQIVLRKPFPLHELATLVRSCLTATARRDPTRQVPSPLNGPSADQPGKRPGLRGRRRATRRWHSRPTRLSPAGNRCRTSPPAGD